MCPLFIISIVHIFNVKYMLKFVLFTEYRGIKERHGQRKRRTNTTWGFMELYISNPVIVFIWPYKDARSMLIVEIFNVIYTILPFSRLFDKQIILSVDDVIIQSDALGREENFWASYWCISQLWILSYAYHSNIFYVIWKYPYLFCISSHWQMKHFNSDNVLNV